MHPYRDVPSQPTRQPAADPEGFILYGILAAIGAIPVVVALVERTMFGADATLGLIMLAVGVVGMLATQWARVAGIPRRPR